MNHFKSAVLAAAAALVFSGAAFAGPHWTFANVGMATGDGDATDDTKFIGIEGCLAVADVWHVQGKWAMGETESNGGRDVDIFQLGVGRNQRVNASTDLVVDVFMGSIDETNGGGGSTESDYWGYSLGVRSMITKEFEFNAAMNYANVDCPAGCGGAGGSAVNVGGEIGGRYKVNKDLSVGASLNWDGVQGDLLTVYVRWAFDDIF